MVFDFLVCLFSFRSLSLVFLFEFESLFGFIVVVP